MLIVSAGVILFFLLIGVLFRKGKGAFLIAGYNTAPAWEKDRYDEKALCRFMGTFMFILAACWAVVAAADLFHSNVLRWAGFALFLAAVTAGVVYANTGNRFKK